MHVYSSHLPAQIRDKVDATEQFLLQDIQGFLVLLKEGQNEKIRSFHFRTIETFFRLKFTMPFPLCVNLIKILVDYIFHSKPELDNQIKGLNTVVLLLKKCHKANYDLTKEINIDWKIPFELWESKYYVIPLPILHDSEDRVNQFKTALLKFLNKARPYYSEHETMWSRLLPQLEQTNEEVCFKAAAQLSVMWPAHAEVNHLLPDWIRIWSGINTNQDWDFHWLRLFARVAKVQQRRQTFDLTTWGPHLPIIFSKIQQIFNLPSDLGAPPSRSKFPTVLGCWHGDKSAMYYASKLSVELLEPTLRTHELLHLIFELLTPFYHPSSAGNAGNGIADFTYYVSAFLSLRLGSEKALGREQISHATILEKLVELSFFGIYAKSQSVSSKASYTLRNVISLNPSTSNSIVAKILRGLDPMAVSQTHQAPSAISALTICGSALLRGGLSWSDHFASILQLTLPGIDPNDDGKTQRTLQLYSTWLMYLPLSNDTSKSQNKQTELASQYRQKLNEKLYSPSPMSDESFNSIWRIGSTIESWVLLLVDRLLLLLKNQDKPKAKGVKSDDTFQIAVHNHLVLSQLFVQMSPSLYSMAINRVSNFLQSNFLPNAGKGIARLLNSIVGPCPDLAFQKFLEPSIRSILSTKNLIDQELMWQLRIIDGVLQRATGTYLVPIREKLQQILDLALAHSNPKVAKLGCKILRHILARLTSLYQPDHSRSMPPNAWNDGVEHAMAQYVGITYSWGNVSIEWHEPSAPELVFASDLLQTYVIDACASLKNLLSDSSSSGWRALLRSLLHAVRGSKNILLENLVASDAETPILLSQPLKHLQQSLADHPAALARILSIRQLVFETLHLVRLHWSDLIDPQQNKCLRYVIRILNTLLHPRDNSQRGESLMYRKWRKISARDVASVALHRKKIKNPESIPMLPRLMMQDRIQMLCTDHLNEISFQWSRTIRTHPHWYSPANVYQSHEVGLGDLLALSLHHDSKIRQTSQSALDSTLKRYTTWLVSQLPQLIAYVHESNHKDRLTGSIHVLQFKRSLHTLWKNWQHAQDLIIALCIASEPKELLNAEDQLKTQTRVLKLFLSVLTTIRDTQSVVDITPLLKLEPIMQSHWRHQLMFLASLLPWIRTDTPITNELWHIVLRGLRSDIPQLQHFARSVLSRMLKANAQRNEPLTCLPEELFEQETLKAIAKDMVLNHKSAARSADGQSTDNSPARWSLGVSELFQLVDRERYAPFLRSYGQKSADNILQQHVVLVSRLAQHGITQHQDIFTAWGIVMKDLFSDDSDERRASLCTGGEIIVGLSHADPAHAASWYLPFFESILPKLSIPYAKDWYDVVLLLSRIPTLDLNPLTNYILTQLELSFQGESTTDGLNQVRWLILIQPILLLFQTCNQPSQNVIQRIRKVIDIAFSHPYESVREQVGGILYQLALSSNDLFPLDFKFQMDSTTTEEKELNARKSLLNMVASYIHHGDTREFKRILPIFNIVFDTQSYPDQEIAKSARSIVDAVSNKLRLDEIDIYNTIIDIMTKSIRSTSWRLRGCVLGFLTIINFYHALLKWSKNNIQNLIISRFLDEKRDVQEMAQYSLRSFLRTLNEKDINILSNEFLNQSINSRNIRIKKEKELKRHRILIERNNNEESIKKLKILLKQDDTINNNKTIQSCYGMGSIILAYPYSVPNFIPFLLQELSYHLHLNGSISYLHNSIKNVLLEFKRTHQDSWHQDKIKFTKSQLESIEELLISPHYYS